MGFAMTRPTQQQKIVQCVRATLSAVHYMMRLHQMIAPTQGALVATLKLRLLGQCFPLCRAVIRVTVSKKIPTSLARLATSVNAQTATVNTRPSLWQESSEKMVGDARARGNERRPHTPGVPSPAMG
jgi:hypothetical protein